MTICARCGRANEAPTDGMPMCLACRRRPVAPLVVPIVVLAALYAFHRLPHGVDGTGRGVVLVLAGVASIALGTHALVRRWAPVMGVLIIAMGVIEIARLALGR